MSEPLHRRDFLAATAATGFTLGATGQTQAQEQNAAGANNRLVLGMIGTGGRGTELTRAFQAQPGVEIAYVCDADHGRAERAAQVVQKATNRAPRVVTDLRRVLDDRAVDVVVIATCNHWHAPAAILACSANKHVYVEKPLSHNPREGELLIQAAQKNKRQLQMGNQRRSWPRIIEAMEEVHKGAIGRAYLSQAYYTNNRPTIGRGNPGDPPKGLDYDLWQGPAPRRPFRSNYLHYNWHWFWHWGNGELGNNGIHSLDLCRWGLEVDYPIHVTSSGGRYRFQDDQETPDTHVVCFDFPDRKTITWEGLSCNKLAAGKVDHVRFYGDGGVMCVTDSGYVITDPNGREVRRNQVQSGDSPHFANFLNACRGNGRCNSGVENAHKSTLLCHLGNIAQRTGRALQCDPKNGTILNDRPAMAYWTREYEKGWEPRV
jgi:predicted dehydrogenase